MHFEIFIPLTIVLLLYIVPIAIGVFWMGPDAGRRGQPGWLWALLTIPFSWITVFVYVILRAL